MFKLTLFFLFLFRLHGPADAMGRETDRGRHGKTRSDLIGRSLDAEARNMRQPLVHREHLVPVVVRRARHTPVSALYRPARPGVVFDRGTIEERLRSFTAHFIQAPAVTVPFITPFAYELSGVEVPAPLAVVMDP